MIPGNRHIVPHGRIASTVTAAILWLILAGANIHVLSVLAFSIYGPLYSGSIQYSCTVRSHDAFPPEASVVSDSTAISLLPLGLDCTFLSPSSNERLGTMKVDDWSDTFSAGSGVVVGATAVSMLLFREVRARRRLRDSGSAPQP